MERLLLTVRCVAVVSLFVGARGFVPAPRTHSHGHVRGHVDRTATQVFAKNSKGLRKQAELLKVLQKAKEAKALVRRRVCARARKCVCTCGA